MDITRKNFHEQFDNISKDLKRSSFIGFDAEFTAILSGECFKHRLFDTNEERYDQIKNEVGKMIMTQVGLTMFQYDRDHDSYVATSYTFHLCPQVFGDIDQSFIFQASTLKFLCKHHFDFNKFTYEGLPYLSKAEEERTRKLLKEKTLLNNITQSMEMSEERELQQHCSEVSKWLTNSDNGTLYLDIENPILRYVIHNEVRLRFPDVLTTDSLGNSNKVLIYRDKYVEGANSAPMAILEENLMTYLLGFSHIISLLASSQKPIIGHNIFLDSVLLHTQFIGPLPKKYSAFKKNINEMFPMIFDTKYISHEMGKRLTFDEMWKSNALQDLYEFFSEGKCRKLQSGVNLIRLSTPFNVKQSYHEAGWDSYCSGYCFIRLGHWVACENIGNYRPVGPTEKLAALKPFCNKVNIIRGSVPYMAIAMKRFLDIPTRTGINRIRVGNAAGHPLVYDILERRLTRGEKNLVGNDPQSHRPKLLHVKSLNERVINVGKVASVLAGFGSIDVKPYGSRTALVAATSQYAANNILSQFRDSPEYRISHYSPYRHSVAGRLAIWSGALITGSLLVYFLHKEIK